MSTAPFQSGIFLGIGGATRRKTPLGRRTHQMIMLLTDIKIVAKLPGKGSKDIAFKACEDMLQAHSNLNGIFAINDPSALGAVAAIEKAGRAGRIKVIGIDGQPEGRQAIRAGKIYADVIQDPQEIGRKAVEAIVQYNAGEEVDAEILIDTKIYRQEDALQDPTLK